MKLDSTNGRYHQEAWSQEKETDSLPVFSLGPQLSRSERRQELHVPRELRVPGTTSTETQGIWAPAISPLSAWHT